MIDENMVERVARAIRRGRFERNGRGAAYDPDLPLHETELADARAAIEEIQLQCREAFVDTIPIVDIADIDRVD